MPNPRVPDGGFRRRCRRPSRGLTASRTGGVAVPGSRRRVSPCPSTTALVGASAGLISTSRKPSSWVVQRSSASGAPPATMWPSGPLISSRSTRSTVLVALASLTVASGRRWDVRSERVPHVAHFLPVEVLDRVPTALAVVSSHDATILRCNRHFAELLGVERDLLVGSNALDLVPDPDRRWVGATARATVRERGTREVEFTTRGADGPVMVRAGMSSIGQPHGQVDLVVTLTDITETHHRSELYQSLFDRAPLAAALVTADSRYSAVNDRFAELCGYPVEDLLADRHGPLVDVEELEALAAATLHAVSTGESASCESWLLQADGNRRRVRRHFRRLDADRDGPSLLVFVEDLTEELNVRRELSFLFDASPVAAAEMALDGRFLRANERYLELTGRQCSDLRGSNAFDLLDDPELASSWVGNWITSGTIEPNDVEIPVARPDGTTRWVRVHLEVVVREGGAEPSIVSVLLDVTEEREQRERLAFEAEHDGLTGVANRNRLLRELENMSDRPHAVSFLDLDRFKQVNDRLGHEAGDRLLLAVADRLISATREGDVVGRLGGDEFVVVHADVGTISEAKRLGQRLLDSLRDRPFLAGGDELHVTASVGVAVSRGSHHGPEQLLRDADVALYRSKDRGRNRVVPFDDAARAERRGRAEMLASLRQALESGELHVAYQPIVSVTDGRIVSAEALARWCRPDGTWVPPSVFIPLAEESGFITELGRSVLTMACVEAAEWMARGDDPGLGVSVNLSLRQCLDVDLVPFVAETLRRAGLPAERLVLEITESTVMDDPERMVDRIVGLADMGVGLAIDDFGTGYSSLAHLRRFDVDILKIDRTFVEDLASDPEARAIATAIVRMGESLGLSTTAEGVETEEQLAVLRELGCDRYQGYLCSPAISSDELFALALSRRSAVRAR